MLWKETVLSAVLASAFAVSVFAGANANPESAHDGSLPAPIENRELSAVSAADWKRFSVLTPAGPDEPPPEIFRTLKRFVYARHTVLAGESVFKLAKKYGTTKMSIQTTNDKEMYLLYTGMKVLVHNKRGMLFTIPKGGVNLGEIAARYRRTKRGRRKFKEAVVKANRLPGSALLGVYEFKAGQILLLPRVAKLFDTYRFPFKGKGKPRVSSPFGSRYHPVLRRRRNHEGLDLPKPWGTKIYPSRSGKIIQAGWIEGYGLTIRIKHSGGATTRYGHLSRIYVKVGQPVQRGKTLIGRVGSTGIATGPHLHFEVRDRHGKPVNPDAKIGRR